MWLAGFFPKRQRTALDCRGCCCLSHSGRTTRGPWSPEGWAQGQRLGVSKNVRGPVWGCWCRGPGSCTPHGARTGQRAPGARRKLALWAGVLRVLCSLSGWQLGSPVVPGPCAGAQLLVWGRDQNSGFHRCRRSVFVIRPQNKTYGSFKVQTRLSLEARWMRSLDPAVRSLGWGPVPQ